MSSTDVTDSHDSLQGARHFFLDACADLERGWVTCLSSSGRLGKSRTDYDQMEMAPVVRPRGEARGCEGFCPRFCCLEWALRSRRVNRQGQDSPSRAAVNKVLA